MKNNLRVPLLCSSLIFFVFFIITGVLSFVNPDRDLFWGIVPATVGIVSLAGTIITISGIRKESKFWYLGVPHAIVLAALCIVGPFLLIVREGSSFDILFILLGLLPLTSVGFFFAFSDLRGNITKNAALISGLICIYSIFCIYTIVGGILSPLRTSWNMVVLIEAIYLMFLMPIIGFCYIAVALMPGIGTRLRQIIHWRPDFWRLGK